LIADGLKYEYSSTIFNSSGDHQDIKIIEDEDIETKIVYLVKRHSNNTHLQYNGLFDMVYLQALNKLAIMGIKVHHELV
jgi:hypothetical protein